MKNTFQIIKVFILFFALLSISGCEKDLYEDAIQQEKEFSMKNVSLRDLSKSDNSNLFKAVEKIRIKKESLAGKIVYDSINKIYFDDENGKMIEKENGYQSFTFPVYRTDGEEKIENILFTKNEVGEFDTYTVKYSFTEEELKLFTQQQINQQTITYTDITAGRQNIVCVDFLEWESYPIDQGDLTGYFGYTGHWVVKSSMCENVADYEGGTMPTTGGTGSTGWGTGTFGGTTSNNTTGGVITTPLTTPGIKFINRLNFATREYVLALTNEAQQVIFNYLTTTNFSNQNYVKFALEHINNYEWLIEQSTQSQVNIFNYLAQNNFNTQSTNFVNETISNIINNNNTLLDCPNFNNNIITTNVPPCLNNLINRVKTLQNGKFGQVISQFAGNNPVPQNYNWNITIGSLNTNNPGNTTSTVSAITGNVTTTINSSYLNTSTDLSLVKTLIHECFHAYLVSVYRYRNIDTNYVNLLNTYYSQFNNNSNDAQHHFFAVNNIINEIATAILEYGNTKGYNLTQQFCEDLAWSGLQGTNAYNNLPLSDQERIESVMFSEFLNSNNAPENILGLTPKGVQVCP